MGCGASDEFKAGGVRPAASRNYIADVSEDNGQESLTSTSWQRSHHRGDGYFVVPGGGNALVTFVPHDHRHHPEALMRVSDDSGEAPAASSSDSSGEHLLETSLSMILGTSAPVASRLADNKLVIRVAHASLFDVQLIVDLEKQALILPAPSEWLPLEDAPNILADRIRFVSLIRSTVESQNDMSVLEKSCGQVMSPRSQGDAFSGGGSVADVLGMPMVSPTTHRHCGTNRNTSE